LELTIAKASQGRSEVAHCWAHVRREFLECVAPEVETG
jgi:transposase